MKTPTETKESRKKRMIYIWTNSLCEAIVDFLIIIGIATLVLFIMFMVW